MPDNKTYRIKANIGENHVDIDTNLVQDVGIFEFLSLKIDSENLYRMHTANYGCVAGRVLANNAIGVPNAKISIFIEATPETNSDAVLSYLYPYTSVNDVDSKNIRYNLLPEEQLFTCHRNVGTFPSKRLVLDDNNVFEVFDKYYKFTTTTNSAGDYMIFGVPVGNQMLHMDVDLSDIGDLLSQRPRDFLYKGYNVNQFENAGMFKKDTNLNSLVQIFTQDESVNVHPFWGEVDEMGEVDSTGVRITRKDINLNYKFEPTCVFMGSLITDEKSNGFTKRCVPTERMGKMDRLTTGEGTIEMIRKTPDGSVEEFSIMGNQLIDGNGVWCYQIPMNLDYVMTDEYGNIVPTNDPEKGLPTRAKVRFRFSLNDFASDYENNHLSKLLVPNNPQKIEDMNDTYVFGTKTPDDEFRDLFWNKVYSVKSYIPRIQKSNSNKEKRFSGIKAVNVNVGNNPIPYNNMRIDITFMFTLQCAIMHSLIWIAGVFNILIAALTDALKNVKCSGVDKQMYDAAKNFGCVTIGDGMCPDLEGWYFAPKCREEKISTRSGDLYFLRETARLLTNKENAGAVDSTSAEAQESSTDDPVCVTNNIKYFLSCIEMSLAQEYEVIQFDFYNDWINGLLYIPRWFANIKRKRRYFFGLLGSDKVITQACMEGSRVYQRRYVQQCAVEYKKPTSPSSDGLARYSEISSPNGCVRANNSGKYPQKCHKGKGRKNVKIFKRSKPGGGLVHSQQTLRSQYVYYFRPCDWVYNGMKDVRVNYFATDIILLGSLSLHDMDGIPQSFKELSSSSYQMPTNIAATNMDTAAYMYGTSNGAFCTGHGINTVKRGENTFEAYSQWGSTTDFSDDLENDPNEYEVTEASGIDWGYTGPDQEMYLKNGTYYRSERELRRSGNVNGAIKADYNNSFFQPGGHFLGIACFNAESNVKSCVNLSRICEIGAEMSQRRAVIRRNGSSAEYDRAFLVPTGLISKDDISDSSFRAEFATLNHNGLCVSGNQYDFVSMLPKNFDGSLKKKIEQTSQMSPSPYNNTNGLAINQDKEYTRTIEENSVDYYDFRLGIGSKRLPEGTKAEDRYLIVNSGSGTASLPMYNNSYYFYFGLHDGSTALDRFYKDFFAQCPDFNDDKVVVNIATQDIDPCVNKNGGIATITVIGVSTDVDNELSYVLKKDGEFYSDGQLIGISEFTIGGLSSGQYEITFSCNDIDDFSRSFTLIEIAPPWINTFIINVVDFTEQKYDTNTADTQGRGYVTVSWEDNDQITKVVISGSTYNNNWPNNEVDNGPEKKKFLPDGDATYTIYVEYNCNGTPPYPIYTFTPAMPHVFDLLIGGSREVTYNRTLSGYSNDDWWESVLNGSDQIAKFFVEKAISYNTSLFLKESDGIEVEPRYGITPYTITLEGSGEMVRDDDNIFISNSPAAGYDVSYTDFYIPTRNVPSDKIGYKINGAQKTDYFCVFADRNGSDGSTRIPASGKLTLPSIYKPFFFRCIIFKDRLGLVEQAKYSITIANGNTNAGAFSKVSVCGKNLPQSEVVSGPSVNWWTLNGGNIEDYQIYKSNGTFLNGEASNGEYSVVIKEKEPDESNPVLPEKSVIEDVEFIGEGNSPDNRVRYFMLYRSTANGTRQNISSNPDYMNEIRTKLRDVLTNNDGSHIVDGGQTANAIYWGGSCTKAFDITLNDGGHLIFNPSNEINRERIFAGDVSVIPHENRLNDCFVLGIFDPWTQLEDVDFRAAQNSSFLNGKYAKVGKDTDMLTIMKLYYAADFVRMVENPGMYDDTPGTSDADTVTEKNMQPFYISVDTGDAFTRRKEGYTDLCTFTVENDSHNHVIAIPEITINAATSMSMYPLRIEYLVIEIFNEDAGTRDFILWKDMAAATDVMVINPTELVTIANDYTTEEYGYGRYVVRLNYAISIEEQYGVSYDGFIQFNGGTITVTRR